MSLDGSGRMKQKVGLAAEELYQMSDTVSEFDLRRQVAFQIILTVYGNMLLTKAADYKK